MPVDDHPVHEKTRISSDFRYGCHNRKPYDDGYYAPDRIYRGNGTYYQVLTFIKRTLSTDCRYDRADDPACEGCNWRKQ